MTTTTQSGRSGAGNLRNFKQMSDAKLAGVLADVLAEDNDPEAIEAYKGEAARRGLGAATIDPDAPASRKVPATGPVAPMLCGKADELPSGDWTFEVKWDGFRCVAVVQDGAVELWSRNKKPYSFPHVAAQLAHLPDCIIDGELVVMTKTDQGGDFQAIVDGHPSAVLVAFDLLGVEGVNIRMWPIEDRREKLEEMLASADKQIVMTSPVYGLDDVMELIDAVADLGLEGVVAKRVGSSYRDGTRGPAWLKYKSRPMQEFAVVGWTDGQNGASGRMGALLLAYNTPDGFRYCGSVGTGWDRAEAHRLTDELKAIKPASASDYLGAKQKKGEHYIQPVMVVQVAFQRWTKDGHLFHPSYKGERRDKPATDVTKES